MDFSPDSLSPVLSILCVPSASQLDLSNNMIGGHYEDQNYEWGGEEHLSTIFVAEPEGAQAIAGALRVIGALTSVDLRGNKLGDEGWGAIFAAICDNKDSKIIAMDASSENIGPAGVKLIAEALRTSVTGSLTEVRCAPSAQMCTFLH